MEHMIHHASYLGIGDKVIFTGFLRNEARARLFALADLLVMPSVSEPFGIVPLEALLNGTPVIISKQSGVAEVIKNALKADFWDTEDMAHKILSVLAYPVLHEALRVHGEREARGQVWQRAARRCVSVYKKLIHLFTRKKEVVT
jgi:glycosyltransferase involved in cell wall biosynthesis